MIRKRGISMKVIETSGKQTGQCHFENFNEHSMHICWFFCTNCVDTNVGPSLICPHVRSF